MNREDILKYFKEHYKIIGGGAFHKGRKIYIGDSSNRKCRFCNKDQNEMKFSMEAHAIPEFLGNKQLILLDECDECNTFFSENLEDHLDKYTKPFRTIFQIKGKRKVPTYKSRDKKGRLEYSGSLNVKFLSGSKFVKFDEKNNEFTLLMDFEPHIPAAVYKALVKIALSIIKDNSELEAFKYTIKWIRSLDHSKQIFRPLKIWTTFLPGPPRVLGVNCMLLRKKVGNTKSLLMGNNTPYSIFILAFGNLIYQIIIPSHLDAGSTGQITFSFPNILLLHETNCSYGKPISALVNVSDYTRVTKSEPIIWHYDEKIEVPIQKQNLSR